MSGRIEQKIFCGFKPIPDKLKEFGFDAKNGVNRLIAPFFDGQFRLDMTVSGNGEVFVKVVEVEFEDEYPLVNVEDFNGGFVGEVRQKLTDELLKIRDACFVRTTFIGDQANRIAALIAKRYDEYADYPFSDDDVSGVFRVKPTRKWYALVMNIKRCKLTPCDEDVLVDVVNLKCDETRRDEMLSIGGVFPAYHMNKLKWISVLLDDTLSDEAVMALIATSRDLIVKKINK